MKEQGLKTLKIPQVLHKVLKVHCVNEELPLQDFVISTLNSALPHTLRVNLTHKKKKVK